MGLAQVSPAILLLEGRSISGLPRQMILRWDRVLRSGTGSGYQHLAFSSSDKHLHILGSRQDRKTGMATVSLPFEDTVLSRPVARCPTGYRAGPSACSVADRH
jgi:hypothetical protein